MINFTNPKLYRSAVGKSSNKGAAFDIEEVAANLVESFSADDGIASEDRMDFVVDFAADNDVSSSPCQCDIVTTDCLDVLACMTGLHDPEREKALAWTGIELRKSMRETSEIAGLVQDESETPLGKALQYNTIDTWKAWRSSNILPAGYDPRGVSIFVREGWYPDCLVYNPKTNKTDLRFGGHSCFYRGLVGQEDSAGAIPEDKARRWYDETFPKGEQTRRKIRTILDGFFEAHQPGSDRQQPAHFSPLGNLMLFAHTTRMLFNRRSFLDEIYQEKLTSVSMPPSETGPALRSGTAAAASVETTTGTVDNDNPFNVALHIRRGDSCGKHDEEDYEEYEREASLLHSIAQVGSERRCYQTEVYLDQVRRIRGMVPRERPLHVYLATDDVGDLAEEIAGRNPRENYGIDVLHYLDYSREHFRYDASSIEDDENRKKQPKLGETAVADLWLLSHGDAFVGHKGSRFGKISWLLAMARRNNFVPFASVDGHSFCCEVDENCGAIKPYITVDNCLTFGHEYLGLSNEDYWESGSTARKTHFLEQRSGKTGSSSPSS